MAMDICCNFVAHDVACDALLFPFLQNFGQQMIFDMVLETISVPKRSRYMYT